MAKQKRKKNKPVINTSGVVKYGEDKFVVLIISMVIYIELFVVAKLCEDIAVLLILFIICSPMLLFTFFMFRFCVKYDATKRRIEYRKLFRFRTIDFDDIERIYRKSDTRTTFLIIKAKGHKVGMNTLSCDGTKELQALLKSRLPKKCEY